MINYGCCVVVKVVNCVGLQGRPVALPLDRVRLLQNTQIKYGNDFIMSLISV
jgi:hypothetical protein